MPDRWDTEGRHVRGVTAGSHARFVVAAARFVVTAALVVGLVAAAGTPASAQPEDAVTRVTQLNRDALAAVDKREFEKARELLKRALDICESAGLDKHAIAARTHVHMGVVIIEGFDRDSV